jgi:hypothetical protein
MTLESPQPHYVDDARPERRQLFSGFPLAGPFLGGANAVGIAVLVRGRGSDAGGRADAGPTRFP